MKIAASLKKYFTEQLMIWHRTENFRSLPWKKEKDPYKIWLSEIIMQQTRVEQGTPYYEKFIATYPSVKKLAAAKDEDVYRLWQGLGYYNRCRNLLATARFIATDLKGKFPKDYEKVLQLKGIGNYTAAAIVSFAYGMSYAVVDGNVQRVLARFFEIEMAADGTEGKKYFQNLAQDLLDEKAPAEYNQAIMDFGAVICKPSNPLCPQCVLNIKCFAYRKNAVSLLPVKTKKIAVKKRFFTYLVFVYKDEIWLRKREGNDIWRNLYEPFLIEKDHLLEKKEVKKILCLQDLKKYRITEREKFTQKLSHQIIESCFFIIETENKNTSFLQPEENWVPLKNLQKIAFPKSVVSFFEKKLYF